ncbi:DUF1573 domain-containing protein [Flavobacterium jejuense]|uniref:DUF1573 domain-containing protein n=1 Tax=Flavobacterium jejuense TaxID=1544455 RepID=A0ABX0IXF9_9FLAO|nr:DUF1573 domain-containing protein [Flavobacterium jejuense]NHN27940.1 DUF1573 domain-containing protein [Flavobacterium jejuense]
MLKKTVSLLVVSLLMSVTACKDNGSAKITEDDMKTFESEKGIANTESTQSTEVQTADANKTTKPVDGKYPKIQFNKLEHDFGTIKSGDKVETEFMVTNIGDADLIILDAKGSCGCTVPNPPKEPIKPGSSAPIKVSFDSTGKTGQQSKSVTLTTNTEAGTENFTIKANVLPKEGQGASPIMNK